MTQPFEEAVADMLHSTGIVQDMNRTLAYCVYTTRNSAGFTVYRTLN